MNEAIKQSESPVVGVVWGRMRISNAKNDSSALLTEIALRLVNDVRCSVSTTQGSPKLIGRSDPEPARVTGWRPHCVKALWKLGKC